jgi:hypothetical protein
MSKRCYAAIDSLSQPPWRLSVQAMAKSAHKLAFITGNDKYVTTGVEGSIPVLIKSVSSHALLQRVRVSFSFHANKYSEEQVIFRGTG